MLTVDARSKKTTLLLMMMTMNKIKMTQLQLTLFMTLEVHVLEGQMGNVMAAVSATGLGLRMTQPNGARLKLTADVNLKKTLKNLQMKPLQAQTTKKRIQTPWMESGLVTIGLTLKLMLSSRMEWCQACHKMLRDVSQPANIT